MRSCSVSPPGADASADVRGELDFVPAIKGPAVWWTNRNAALTLCTIVQKTSACDGEDRGVSTAWKGPREGSPEPAP